MLELTSHDEPNIIYESENKKRFKIFTLATSEIRHYRIIKETDFGFFNYDFLVDLSNFEKGSPFVFEIPFISEKFIDSRLSQPEPSVPNFNTDGEIISEGIYKLVYISRSEEREIPAKIDLNRIYLVGVKKIKILYYRHVENQIYYTGYFGNLFLDSEIIPEFSININLDYNIIIEDNIHYYLVKINSTPNLVISSYRNDIKFITENYSDENYEYKLESLGDGYNYVDFVIFLTIKKISTSEIIKNKTDFKIISDKDVEIISMILPSVTEKYKMILRLVDIYENEKSVNFKLYIE